MKVNKGKSFVTIMIVIAFSALLLRIAIENLVRINIAQNESRASATLKFISAALENYAKDNNGIYPASLSVLTQSKPPYLEKKYIDDIAQSPVKGYSYNCPTLELSGYNCYASPVRCKFTGNTVYVIATGSPLKSEECKIKE